MSEISKNKNIIYDRLRITFGNVAWVISSRLHTKFKSIFKIPIAPQHQMDLWKKISSRG